MAQGMSKAQTRDGGGGGGGGVEGGVQATEITSSHLPVMQIFKQSIN